ncbi:hypothetical protein B0A49_07908, partial [Cryomyces minteri]
MEVAQDTLPELQPIFTFLNSHQNKLYQEGYFLKLHDLDSRGRPSGDRTLYGRPNRLIADSLDQRGLMFAMPKEKRYGYLEILDVSSLIHTNGSQTWSERQWRKELKKLTASRMTTEDSPR